MSIIDNSVSRRQFLKTSSGVALFIGVSGILPQLISCKNVNKVQEQLEKHRLTAWVQLSEDGQIIIYSPAAEMGQGSMTALPLIFAEEMDADWNKVSVKFSPQESAIYGSNAWGPSGKVMLTAGSRSTIGYYPVMRKAGAQARYVLMYSAAKKWEVPITELSTKPGIVVHSKSNREMGYGDVVPFLEMPEMIPDFTNEQLKRPSEYRLIGKVKERREIPDKVTGSAQFAIDIRLPNMVYGVLERGRVHGAKPNLINEDHIMGLEGVLKIVRLDYAIGIIAATLEQALIAKKQLDIDWSDAEATGFNSQEIYSEYEKIAASNQKGKVITDLGNVKQALRTASKTYTIDFKNDYVYHAQMEPLNSVIQVASDGQSAEVWVGSQQGFDPKLSLPKTLGIAPENVVIHLQYLGGGFGRRSMDDFVIECGLLAKEMLGRPVKLIWTREDDVTYGAYRPLTLQRVTAGTDIHGNITAFSHCVIGDGGNLVAGGIKNKFYDIPNQFAEWKETTHGIRLKHWRAVGHGPNKFAIECMLDEIATEQNLDPVDLRRKLMAKSPNALATLEKVAKMSDWDSPTKQGRAKGVAFLEHSGALSSGVCEISVDRNTGKIKVHHFWSAIHAGVIIQPNNVEAQLEGGIIMGMSSVLKEQITIKDGEIQQSNFHNYQLLRMEDIPDSIETAMLESTESPKGIGESGTPMVACAIANAFLSLTGKRLRHLPFTPDRVLEVLNS